MRLKQSIITLLSIFVALPCLGQSPILKQTCVYKDTFTLDVYVDTSLTLESQRPVLIHTHGGGWNSGDKVINPNEGVWKDFLAEGFVVASIDYRQGVTMAKTQGKMKGVPAVAINSSDIWQGYEAASIIRDALTMAVEDLYDATNFILQNGERWNIDPKCVMICGGSAGAFNCYTGEYWLVNGEPIALERLPKDFRYAGIIGGAGGILVSGEGPLQWKERPCPIMLFHGDADSTVPIEQMDLAAIGSRIYGTLKIEQSLHDICCPYWVRIGEKYDHVMSGFPFEENGGECLSFYRKFVKNGEQLHIHSSEGHFDEPRTLVNYFVAKLGLSKEQVLAIIHEMMTPQEE